MKTFGEFINESRYNWSERKFKETIDQVTGNPAKYEASDVEVITNRGRNGKKILILRFYNAMDRKNSIVRLKREGVPSQKMNTETIGPRSSRYRYQLNVLS